MLIGMVKPACYTGEKLPVDLYLYWLLALPLPAAAEGIKGFVSTFILLPSAYHNTTAHYCPHPSQALVWLLAQLLHPHFTQNKPCLKMAISNGVCVCMRDLFSWLLIHKRISEHGLRNRQYWLTSLSGLNQG